MTTELQTPRDFVQSGWDYQRSLAQRWVNLSEHAIGDLTELQVPQMTFDVPVELQYDYGTFLRPTAPALEALPEIAVTLPAPLTLAEITAPAITAAPDEPDFGGLTYTKPTAPNAPMPTVPAGLDVVLDEIRLPDAPTYTLPEAPSLYAIRLPEFPDLVVPEFDAARPMRTFDIPGNQFSYTPTAYDDSLVQTIKARLADMTINGLGLPPDIEQAIFDRARGREAALTAEATQDYADELASRGLRQPGGMLLRGLRRIRSDAAKRTSGASRDLSIEVARQNVEAVRFALSTAIGLEVALIQANTANNELALRAAQATQQVSLDLFNAKVALHNADVQAYQADAQVFAERIRALQAQADMLRTRIEAQKAIGDVNESMVRAYAERIRAIEVLGNFYKTTVEGAVARGELNKQRLEQVRLKLDGFTAQVDAWGKQQDGYRTAVDAEAGNIRAFEALGNVYGRRIEAWRTKNAAYFDQGRFQIDAQAQQINGFRAALERAQTDGRLQAEAIDARLRAFASRVGIFAAEAQVSSAQADSQDRNARLRMEAAKLRVDTLQRNTELAGNYALKTLDVLLEQYKAKAQIVSNLAASTMSGVNFGASYSGSISQGLSYSRGYSYSGETPDDTPEF